MESGWFGEASASAGQAEQEARNGEHGGPLLAEQLGVPHRTWAHFESGVAIPATTILDFIAATGVSPRWLATGEGEKFTGTLADRT